LVPLAGLALALAVVGGVLRSRVSSLWLVTAVLAAVAALYVVLVGADQSPSLSSFGDFLMALSEARTTAQNFEAPVPATAPGVHALLLLGGAVFLVLFDLLACTLRLVPVAGLVLLAVVTLPVA